MSKSIWLAALLVPALSACMSATPSATSFGASLSGANEVPAVAGSGTGSVSTTLSGSTLTLNGSYSGLSGLATMAHIHGPAGKTATAGVLFPLTFTNAAVAGSGTLSASLTLSDAQIADLRAGKWYVNVHTAANAAGEVRGQLEAK